MFWLLMVSEKILIIKDKIRSLVYPVIKQYTEEWRFHHWTEDDLERKCSSATF